jgi:hypothetical protein
MDNSTLTIGARDADQKIIGGLVANLQPGWKWMHVHRLCGFYENQGYRVYAVLEDYPVGHRKFMLRKTLPKVE